MQRLLVGGCMVGGSFSLATQSQASSPQEVDNVLWRVYEHLAISSTLAGSSRRGQGLIPFWPLGWDCPLMTHLLLWGDANLKWLHFLWSLSTPAFKKCFCLFSSYARFQQSYVVGAGTAPILQMRKLRSAPSSEARFGSKLLVSGPISDLLSFLQVPQVLKKELGKCEMWGLLKNFIIPRSFLRDSMSQALDSLRAGWCWLLFSGPQLIPLPSENFSF
jgi:hypothetical protein